jgi:hypothetical protein
MASPFSTLSNFSVTVSRKLLKAVRGHVAREVNWVFMAETLPAFYELSEIHTFFNQTNATTTSKGLLKIFSFSSYKMHLLSLPRTQHFQHAYRTNCRTSLSSDTRVGTTDFYLWKSYLNTLLSILTPLQTFQFFLLYDLHCRFLTFNTPSWVAPTSTF